MPGGEPPTDLRVGETVIYRDEKGTETEYVVVYEPWQREGRWVVGLNGPIVGYALDRVRRAPPPAEGGEA